MELVEDDATDVDGACSPMIAAPTTLYQAVSRAIDAPRMDVPSPLMPGGIRIALMTTFMALNNECYLARSVQRFFEQQLRVTRSPDDCLRKSIAHVLVEEAEGRLQAVATNAMRLNQWFNTTRDAATSVTHCLARMLFPIAQMVDCFSTHGFCPACFSAKPYEAPAVATCSVHPYHCVVCHAFSCGPEPDERVPLAEQARLCLANYRERHDTTCHYRYMPVPPMDGDDVVLHLPSDGGIPAGVDALELDLGLAL